MAWKSTGAEVLISDTYATSLALQSAINGLVCKIYATTHTVVKEYRGMTKAAAQAFAAEHHSCTKSNYTSTYQYGTVAGAPLYASTTAPSLVGTEVHSQVRRMNEGGGYAVTVTTNTTTASGSWT